MKRLSPQRFHRSVRSVVVACMAVALVWTFALPAQKAHAQSTQTPWQNLTPSKLTAVWWQWLFSIPQPQSPVFDPTGANAFNSQPYYSGQGNGGLLFLAGTFAVIQLANGNILGQVTRSISVKQGTTFFFPLLNAEDDNVGVMPPVGVPQLRDAISPALDNATGLSATLTPYDSKFKKATGPTQNLGYQRLKSPPFSYTLPATNNLYQFFGIDVSGTIGPAVSDGYWAFIPGTLQAGNYQLQFGGTLTNPNGSTFTEAITYDIIVIP